MIVCTIAAENSRVDGRHLSRSRHRPVRPTHGSSQHFTEGPNAVAAGKAVECASRENQFWQMHDVLFDPPRPLHPRQFPGMAATLGVDAAPFEECMKGDVESQLRTDMTDGRAAPVAPQRDYVG